MKKLSILILSLSLIGAAVYAQTPLAVMDCSRSAFDSTEAVVGSVMSVGREVVLVRMDLTVLADRDSLRLNCPDGYMMLCGGDTLRMNSFYPLKKGTSHPGSGAWRDLKRGEVYSCMAVFSGHIRPGVGGVSIKTGDGSSFYEFERVVIDNPQVKTRTDFRLVSVTEGTALLAGPSSDSELLEHIESGVRLLVDSTDSLNTETYCHAVNPDTGVLGFVERALITGGESVQEPVRGYFISSGSAGPEGGAPTVTLINKSNVRVTVTVSGRQVTVKPQKQKKITVHEGTCCFLTSAPGQTLRPEWGTFTRGCAYNWEYHTVNHTF